MGKTRAEIQRDYRARKLEKEGVKYLEKESKRVKGYYVPIAERSKADVKVRREKVRQWVAKHREVKKKKKEPTKKPSDEAVIEDENGVSSTVGDVATTSGSLLVKFPFSPPPSERVRKRISRTTAKQRRLIEKLKQDNLKLNRKYKAVTKRHQRFVKKIQTKETSTSSTTDVTNSLTPRKRTQKDLRDGGISPSKAPKRLINKLLLANVMSDEIKSARGGAGTKNKKLINQIVSGRITKKYRLRRALGRCCGMDRRTLFSDSKACSVTMKQRKRILETTSVTEFLSRDDNSRQMPGKADAKRVKGEHLQKRILNDSLKNLFLRFEGENPNCKMSFSSFCKLRPKHISLTKFLSRNKCLCQRHQNMALLLKSLKMLGCSVPLNPEEYARKVTSEGPEKYIAEINNTKNDKITYEKWQRVTCDDGKKRMKIVNNEMNKSDFIEMVQKESCEFLNHTSRIKEQYKALQLLKENLPENHVIVQMDFSENFTCSSADEVQSAYWNASTVTLHPIVAYFNADGNLAHKSYVFVSDDGGHNAGTVFAFIKRLIPQLQADIGSVSCIHYWTDSPSSQYRNKSIFHVVSDHQNIFGVPAIWNYFEAGHGKGPCDGIGGTSKRMADLSVRQGKVVIQDASDFFAWGTKYHTSASYVFLTADDIAPMREELQDLTKSAKALKGTMTVHAVVGLSLGVILSRTTSCYCKLCLDGKYHTDWKRDEIQKPTNDVEGAQIPAIDVTPEASGPDTAAAAPPDDPQHVMEEEPVQSDAPVQLDASVQPQRDQYVAAVYQKKWNIGKTKDVDSTECDCLVSFMENTSSKNINQFKWPKREDVIWVSFADILCVLSNPEIVGRYGRSFRFTTDELECVSRLFEQKV